MILSVRDLSFAYGERQVLRDVSLSVDVGEILCIVGPNVSGKTTLLDCVIGALRPQAGEILVCGKSLHAYRKRELSQQIAYVPQQYHPTFPYRVRDVVMMGRTSRVGFLGAYDARDEAVCDEAVRQAGIEALADRPYHTLSGGELRLVMLARALAQEPRLIVLDEPTDSLDVRNELRFLETLSALVREQRISALFATHELNHVFFLERAGLPVRAAMVSGGTMPVVGAPDQVITPQSIAETFGVQAQITSSAVPGSAPMRIVTLIRTIQ